jgi:hypothetical protein
MPTLLSSIITGQINGSASHIITRPTLVLDAPQPGNTVLVSPGTYKDTNGAFQYRWGTVEEGLITGQTLASFLISAAQLNLMLYAEVQTFNIYGNSLGWVRSDIVLIEELVSTEFWVIDGSIIYSDPITPDSPVVRGSIIEG